MLDVVRRCRWPCAGAIWHRRRHRWSSACPVAVRVNVPVLANLVVATVAVSLAVRLNVPVRVTASEVVRLSLAVLLDPDHPSDHIQSAVQCL